MYKEESESWDLATGLCGGMEIRVKEIRKESPAYFIDLETGEESDCRLLDFEIISLIDLMFRDDLKKKYHARCEEIRSKGIAAGEIGPYCGDIIYVSVG